jgi:hypothetical protein
MLAEVRPRLLASGYAGQSPIKLDFLTPHRWLPRVKPFEMEFHSEEWSRFGCDRCRDSRTVDHHNRLRCNVPV